MYGQKPLLFFKEFLNTKHGIMGKATELPWLFLPFLYPSLPFPISQVQEKQREQVMPQLASFPCHPMATRSKTCTLNKKAFTATKHPLPTSYVSALSSNLPRDPASNGIGFLVKGGVLTIAFTRPKVISHACFLKKKKNSLFALPALISTTYPNN
jgi:hypothetical protein